MENQSLPILTIVVPCYNEEEVLPQTISTLSECIKDLIEKKLVNNNSNILFVDDGSHDRTWSIIAQEGIRNRLVKGIKLAKNVGHQKALLAGLDQVVNRCDCVITIDADLQDDVTAIEQFVKKYEEGYEIVYGVRDDRSKDSFFKRTTAEGFYKLMQKLGIELIYNHADFRLLGKRALLELNRFEESNLFLRGIIPLIGFPSTIVYYKRKARVAGTTKYPLKKMLSFAIDGITSFSIIPIRFITFLGFCIFFISLIAASYALMQKFFGFTSRGWTSLMISIWLIGGLQLVAIGMIGEYIGKIFTEVKKRPKYTIDIDLYTKSLLEDFHKDHSKIDDGQINRLRFGDG